MGSTRSTYSVSLGRACLAVLAAATVAACFVSSPAGAQDDGPVTISAQVNGRDVEGAGSNDPVELRPLEVTQAELTVTNTTDEDLTVKRARLFGKAFGLTFVAYDAVVNVPLAAGATAVIEIPVEFVDLERQATGLLPGGFALYDQDRQLLGSQEFVIDVRGSATSALGLFGIFITVATIIGLVGIYLGVKRRTLEPRRGRRAVRFAFVGLGMGLSAVVALAVFRVLAPTPVVWIPLTIVPTLLGALIGFISPGPLRLDEDDGEPDDIEEREYLDELDRIDAEAGDGSEAATGVDGGDPGSDPATDHQIDLTDGAPATAAGAQSTRGHFER